MALIDNNQQLIGSLSFLVGRRRYGTEQSASRKDAKSLGESRTQKGRTRTTGDIARPFLAIHASSRQKASYCPRHRCIYRLAAALRTQMGTGLVGKKTVNRKVCGKQEDVRKLLLAILVSRHLGVLSECNERAREQASIISGQEFVTQSKWQRAN